MIGKTIALLVLLTNAFALAAQQANSVPATAYAVQSISLQNVRLRKPATVNITRKPLSLFIFLSPECPLSQNYTRIINQVAAQFATTVQVYAIVPGSAYTIDEVAAFHEKYKLISPIFIDEAQALTKQLNATITPQAILINSKEVILYSGAIDNWVQALGKKRAHITEHYVMDAITQSLQNKVVAVNKTVAIGCKINDY